MIPARFRSRIQELLWKKADALDWRRLSQSEKAKWYRVWTEDPDIGGVLGSLMDPRKVRVYIKDTLLKSYNRTRLADQSRIFRLLKIAADEGIERTFIKPHGRLLSDGRVICWGPSDNWKAVVLSVFERAFLNDAKPYAAVLVGAVDHLPPKEKLLADTVAKRLDVQLTKLDG